MIAIAVQTIISLALCFAIGFLTAWIVRGGREGRKFQEFFESWRSRYDRLELDCDEHRMRIASLQKELSIANESRTAATADNSAEKSVYDKISGIAIRPD